MSKGKVLLNISIVCIFIAVIITFVFLSINGCVKYYTPYEVNDISNQQFVVRDCIDDCETFDCSVLNNEINMLQEMVNKKENPITQGVQQSIVTTITRKCNQIAKVEYENIPCKCYLIEKEKLNNSMGY